MAKDGDKIVQFPNTRVIQEQSEFKEVYAPAVEMAVVRKIQSEIGDSFRGIVLSYIDTLGASIDKIKELTQSRNYPALSDLLGRLETSSRTIGANRLADMAKQIRATMKTGELKSDPSLLDWLTYDISFEAIRTKEWFSSNDFTSTKEEAEEAKPPLSGASVLIVESDNIAYQMMAEGLERDGCKVMQATNAEEALIVLGCEQPLAIVIDEFLPGIGGLACCEEIRKFDKEIPLLIITEYSDYDTVRGAIERGASDFIPKPVYMPVFRQRMRYMCSTEIYKRKIQYMATHDGLTGLPNRVMFTDLFRASADLAISEGSRFAVMFVDLDGFKDVNDSLGHEVGDKVLQEVAERMKRAANGNIVARIGGDEFLVLVPANGGLEVDAIIPEIAWSTVESISQPFFVNGNRIEIGASIGVSIYPDHGVDQDQLVGIADRAMYMVKENGKNSYRVSEG